MELKKILLSIGAITVAVAPIATVISCGEPSSSQYSEDDLLRISNLKSSEAHAKLQDLWLAKVLMDQYDIKDSTQLQFLQTINPAIEADFESTLKWVLKDKLFASKDALSTIYQAVKTNAPTNIAGDDTTHGNTAVMALEDKVFLKSNIETKVDAIFTDDSWKAVFFNYASNDKGEVVYNPSILGIKDLVLKMLITKKYLSINSAEFKKALPGDYIKLADKFKDNSLIGVNDTNFPLMMSVINSRLAYKNSIELDTTKSGQFIVSNTDNQFDTEAEAMKSFELNGKFSGALTYTLKSQTVVGDLIPRDLGILTTKTFESDSIGFKGIDALPSGKDDLDVSSADALKLVKDPTARDGFVVDEKFVDKDIRFTDKDKTKVEINYYASLLPVYDETKKSLTFDGVVDGEDNMDTLMNVAYTKDDSLYSEAIKYFTEKDDPILIGVTNDWARNYYIDEGLKYVNTKK